MADIKTHLNNIKGALYGKDVRGSIHDGMDAINKEVENTTGRQVDLENTFDQLVINAGNSNAEIVDARVKNDGTSYSKLGDRLDAVDSQLAHNTSKISVFDDERVNVKFFGAKGDGVTDDTEAIKNAISYALERSCDVYIPYGTYIISDTLEFRDLNLIGSVDKPKLKMITEKPVLHISGSSEICRLMLEGCNYQNSNSIGIKIGNDTYTNNGFTIKDIYFTTGFYDCIYSNYECDTAKISHCYSFNTVGRSVIYLDNKSSLAASAGTIIERCHFNGLISKHDNTTNKYGIYFNRGDNVSLRNNIVNNYDICVYIREHWGITVEGLHMEERREIIRNASYWSANKQINVGDIIKPTKINADGWIYIATSSGTTGENEPIWGSAVSDNNVTWNRYKQSIGLASELIKHGKVINITPDCQIIGVNAYSGQQIMSYEGIRHLGPCDYSFKDTSGAVSRFHFRACSFNGNLLFVQDPNAQAAIEYCESINEDGLGYVLDVQGTYYFRCNGNKGHTRKKTITDNYVAHYMRDTLIIANTKDKNIIVEVPLSAYPGKEITIVKGSSDTNTVTVKSDRIPAVVLSSNGDNVTLLNLGYPEYVAIKSLYKK